MGHNMEDLLGLGDVFKMMGYLALRDGEFTIRGTDFDGENLILQMNPHYMLECLAVPFSGEGQNH